MLCPLTLIGAVLIATSGKFLASDIDKVRTATVTMAEVRAARKRGEAKLLVVRDLDVHYDQVQVLFGVDFEVGEGEIVALLGTNGAGKSTLLRAISGLVDPSGGAIVFDGKDVTHPAPDEASAGASSRCPAARACSRPSPSPRTCGRPAWLYRTTRSTWRRPPRRCSSTSRLRERDGPARPATSPAASSRCSRSAWRSSPSPSC